MLLYTALNMEEFAHAVHVAYPEYELLWKQLGRQKYRYYATLEPTMSLEEIKATIIDKKASWQEKTRAMRCACTMICDQKRKENEVTQMIKKLIDALIAALRSNNQLVVREACISVATMAKERTVCLKGVVGKLLKTCWELLDVKIPLIKFSAGECLKIVIKYVPDDSDNKYLKTLVQGTMLHDFSSVRQSCYECIIVMILRAGNPNNTMGNDFWKRIKQIIIDGVSSQETEVKDYAYHCLYAFEKASPQKAQRVLESLDQNIVNEYKKAVFADDDNASNSSIEPSPSPQPEEKQSNNDNNNDNNDNDNDNEQEPEPTQIKPPTVVGIKPETPTPIQTNETTPTSNGSPSPSQSQSPTKKSKVTWPPKKNDDDKKDQERKPILQKRNSGPGTPTGASRFKITPKKRQSRTLINGKAPISQSNGNNNGGGMTITLSTPIPSNDTLSTSYEERTKQIEDIYNSLDNGNQGSLNRFKAMKFLKELMNVNMRNAEIILSGLDSKKTNKFTKDMLRNWSYIHSPEMEPNPLLHQEAESIGWLTLRRPGLEKRIELYSGLLQLEKTDKNYSVVYDLDHKICILNYLLKQC